MTVLQSRSSVLFFLIVLRWLSIMLLSVLGDLLPFNRKQCFDVFWMVAQPSCLLWYQNSWIALFPVFPFPFIFLGPVVMYGVTQLWKVKLINSSVLWGTLHLFDRYLFYKFRFFILKKNSCLQKKSTQRWNQWIPNIYQFIWYFTKEKKMTCFSSPNNHLTTP